MTLMREQRWTRSTSRPCTRSAILKKKDYTLGICLLLLVVFSWTAASFVTQDMYAGGYFNPFFFTWSTASILSLHIFPASLRRNHRRPNGYHRPLVQAVDGRADSDFVPAEHECFTTKETAQLAVYPAFLWLTANWLFNASLQHTSVASATVLKSTSGIFALVFSRIFLGEAMTLLKMGAALLSFLGVIFVSLSDSTMEQGIGPTATEPSFQFLAGLGDTFAVVAAIQIALYTVFLKFRIKDQSRIDMQLFIGFIGLFILILYWPVGLILHLTGIEPFQIPNGRAATAIFINMVITLVADYGFVVAMLKTTPVVATIGMSLTIPLAVLGDLFLGKPAAMKVVIGALLVLIGFIVIGIKGADDETRDHPEVCIEDDSFSQVQEGLALSS